MNHVRWMIKYVRPFRWRFVLTFAVYLLHSFALFAAIVLQQRLIDDVFMEGQYDQFLSVIIPIATCFILYGILTTVAPHISHYNIKDIMVAMTRDYMTKLHHLPIRELRNQRTATLSNHIMKDIDTLSGFIGKEIPYDVRFVPLFLVIVFFIGQHSLLLLVTVLPVCITYFFLGRYFSTKIRLHSQEILERRDQLSVMIEEGVSSTREVIAYNRVPWEKKLYDHLFGHFLDSIRKQIHHQNKQIIFTSPLSWGVNVLTIAIGGYQVLQGTLSPGEFVIIYQLMFQLTAGVLQTFWLAMKFTTLQPAFDRVRKYLDRPDEDRGDILLGNMPIQSLRFDHVCFQYDENDTTILQNVNVSIPIGKKVAIVGSSGSGKSTIASLLIRFYSPTSGTILVNGENLQRIDYEEWMSRVGIVFQEPYLFASSIRNNLMLGRRHYAMEQLIEACRAADIHDYIASLPDQYETVLGERGITLSGGQRQRIALARAILYDPEILILDEATSAIDVATEQHIMDRLDTIRAGKTTIVIAHRLSTVKNADQIIVLDKGTVMQSANHDELLDSDSVYRELVFSQQQ